MRDASLYAQCSRIASEAGRAWHSQTMIHALGLTAAEEAVYLLLLEAPSLTTPELATLHDSTEEGTAVVLARLQAQGLVTPLAGTPVRYTALDPRIGLKGLIAGKEQQLEQAHAAAQELTTRFDGARRGRNPLDVVEVAVGEQAIMTQFAEIQAGALHEVVGFDLPPYIDAQPNIEELEHLRRGVTYRSVYDSACLQHSPKMAEIRQLQQGGEQARILAGVPLKLFIADQRRGLLVLTGGMQTPSCLIVHPSALLDGLIATFETVWLHANPLPVPSSTAGDNDVAKDSPGGSPTAVERELLALIGLGLTDKAIGRQLELSERTVQRMMSAIMTRLAAGTRFQAGVRAKELGWL